MSETELSVFFFLNNENLVPVPWMQKLSQIKACTSGIVSINNSR